MALFPPNFIEDLKSHADIVQVVQERVALRRSGATWKGLCPFHGEKTPSFHVNGDKGFFHCFGCGAKGDVFEFVKLHDKITFPEAAPEAVKKPLIAVDVKRRRLLAVKRAESFPGGAAAPERHALLDHLHDIGVRLELLDEVGREQSHVLAANVPTAIHEDHDETSAAS